MDRQRAPASWSTWTTALALFLVPGFGLYLPNALIVTLAVCALVRVAESVRHRTWPRWRQTPFLLILALALWAAGSALWAIHAKAALEGAASLAGCGFLLLFVLDSAAVLDRASRQRAITSFFAGFALATTMLLIDIGSGGYLAGWLRGYDVSDVFQQELALRSLNRGVTLLAMFSALVVLAAWTLRQPSRRWAGLALSAIALSCALGWGKDAVILAVIAGTAAAFLTLLPGHWPWRLLAGGMAIMVLLWPLAVRPLPGPQQIWEQWQGWPQSLQHRLFIWKFTTDTIVEKPLLGWGMNSAKHIPGGNQDVTVGHGRNELQWRPLPLHPHNAILQWWLELGAIGAVLAGAVVLAAIRALCRLSDRPRRLVGAAIFGQACVVSLLSYGAWQSWWLAGLILCVWLIDILEPLDQA
jgi:O-antigen ligase